MATMVARGVAAAPAAEMEAAEAALVRGEADGHAHVDGKLRDVGGEARDGSEPERTDPQC